MSFVRPTELHDHQVMYHHNEKIADRCQILSRHTSTKYANTDQKIPPKVLVKYNAKDLVQSKPSTVQIAKKRITQPLYKKTIGDSIGKGLDIISTNYTALNPKWKRSALNTMRYENANRNKNIESIHSSQEILATLEKFDLFSIEMIDKSDKQIEDEQNTCDSDISDREKKRRIKRRLLEAHLPTENTKSMPCYDMLFDSGK